MGDFGGTYALHLYRWKARGIDFVFVIIELLSLSLTVRRYKRKLSKSVFFEGGGSLWAKISDGKERRQPTTVDVRKLE